MISCLFPKWAFGTGIQQGLDQGLSAAEAARAARASAKPSDGLPENAAERLLTAIHNHDEAVQPEVLDESLAAFGLEVGRVAREVPLVSSRPGATEQLCKKLRVERPDGDLITAAHEIAHSATA